MRREVRIGQKPYVITLTRDKLRVAVKGRRKGQEVLWEDLVGEHDEPLVLPPAPERAESHARRTPSP